MILVDANLLIYARNASLPQHGAAKRWLDEQFANAPRIGLPWMSLLAFVRITTNPRVFPHPLLSQAAWRQVEDWLDLDTVWTPGPTDSHRSVLAKLFTAISITGNLVPDAHLAALAIEHGLILCSADSNFARFPGLAWQNPLQD